MRARSGRAGGGGDECCPGASGTGRNGGKAGGKDGGLYSLGFTVGQMYRSKAPWIASERYLHAGSMMPLCESSKGAGGCYIAVLSAVSHERVIDGCI